MLAKTSQVPRAGEIMKAPPERGLKVMQVFDNSPARMAGIESGDIIMQYGQYLIVDDASFFLARTHYEDSAQRTVEVVIYRRSRQMLLTVPTGWLGVMTADSDKVSESFWALMNNVKAKWEIPEYMYDREFKGQFNGGPAKFLAQAKVLVDQAERDRTLTPVQIMIARIYMILDDAPEEDLRRQAELLKELFSTQPVSFIHMLGNDKFYADHRYLPAIACLNHYLKFSPDDVSIRLNVGFAYNELGMYDEADRATDYVFEHELGISDYGRYVAYINKAKAALGRKEYSRSIQLGQKAFEFNPNGGTYPLMLIQLAAAQTGDMGRLKATAQRFQQAFPSKYLEWRLQIDAAEAYGLVKNNQLDAARKLVEKWKDSDRPEGRVRASWRLYPDGMDIARNFSDLMKS